MSYIAGHIDTEKCDMLPPPKEAGLPAQQPQRDEYQQAIPVCPTVLSEVTLSAQFLSHLQRWKNP